MHQVMHDDAFDLAHYLSYSLHHSSTVYVVCERAAVTISVRLLRVECLMRHYAVFDADITLRCLHLVDREQVVMSFIKPTNFITIIITTTISIIVAILILFMSMRLVILERAL